MPVEARNWACSPKATPVTRPEWSTTDKSAQIILDEQQHLISLNETRLTREVEHLGPLLADVNSDVRSTDGQICSALIENQRLHLQEEEAFSKRGKTVMKNTWQWHLKVIQDLIIVVQSDCLEVLQFPQIPQLQGAVLSTYRSKTQLTFNKISNLTAWTLQM